MTWFSSIIQSMFDNSITAGLSVLEFVINEIGKALCSISQTSKEKRVFPSKSRSIKYHS